MFRTGLLGAVSSCLVLALLTLTFACESDPEQPGSFERKAMDWGGLEREYFVYLPGGMVPGKTLPLVVGLHGYGGTATGFEQETSGGLNRHAEQEHYIAVYPQGTHFWDRQSDPPGFFSSWNDLETNRPAGPEERSICSNPGHGYPCPPECGSCGDCGWTGCRDDIGFIAEVIEAVSRDYPVDRSRRYMVGLSNGGAMTHRFACSRPDLLAAAVSVSGSIPRDRSCRPRAPLSYLQVYGDRDPVTPINGRPTSDGFHFERPQESLDMWAEAMNCDELEVDAELNIAKSNGLICTRRRNCAGGEDNEVVNCLVPGGGHAWPGHSADVGYCRGEIQSESLPGYPDCRDQEGLASEWGTPAIWEFLARNRSAAP